MKLTAALFCFAWSALACHGADESAPSSRHADAARLLAEMPSRFQLYRAHDAIYKQGYGESERKTAEERLALATEQIPKLRALITVGDNVFDYPGLLAVGETKFVRNRGQHPEVKDKFYRLFIGISEQAGEGQTPNMFGIDFDDTGRILGLFKPGKLVR